MAKNVIVGTAGHIDHGKSALVRALTGTDPDRLKEEKERGITIELGFARLVLPSGAVAGIVDVPGHEKFVRTMVAGAAGIDIVMLVVAADEGIMPQTREHLDICRLLSVRQGLVALNKCDKVDPEWIALKEEEIRAFVAGSFLEKAPIVRVSAVTGQGLSELVAELDKLASGVEGKDAENFFRLPIDRSFTMKGFGTVVTGTLVGGSVRVGEEVVVLPGNATARVRGIQVHKGAVEEVRAGSRTAVNLQGIERESAPRGCVLCHPGTIEPTRTVDVLLHHLPLAFRPLRRGALLSFHAGTSFCLCRIFPYGSEEIPPGGSAFARIELAQEKVLLGQDRFILRGFAPLANFGYTLGGGTVLHPHPPRRPGRLARPPACLGVLQSGGAKERIVTAVEDAGAGGLEETQAAAIAGVGPAPARRLVEAAVSEGLLRRDPAGSRIWHRAALAQAAKAAAEALAALHARFPDRDGFPSDEIAAAVPGDFLPPALAAMALAEAPGTARNGDLYYLSGRRPPSVEVFSPLARAILEKARAAGLAALSKNELAEALRPLDLREFDRTVEGLARAGALVRVKEFYFDPTAVEALREKLVQYLLRHGEITVPQFKELAGLTRKHLIPLIEHFDMARLTLRVGDKRVLRKGRERR